MSRVFNEWYFDKADQVIDKLAEITPYSWEYLNDQLIGWIVDGDDPDETLGLFIQSALMNNL